MQPRDDRVTCIANCLVMSIVTEAVALASIAVAMTAEAVDQRLQAALLARVLRAQSTAYQGHMAYHLVTGH